MDFSKSAKITKKSSDRQVKDLESDLDKVESEISESVFVQLVKAATIIKAEAVDLVNTITGSRRVKRWGDGAAGRVVTVSDPGEPPNTDTGSFVKTIRVASSRGKMLAQVGSTDKRGDWFEMGTRNMEPRPWLSAAVENKRNEIENLIKGVKIDIK